MIGQEGFDGLPQAVIPVAARVRGSASGSRSSRMVALDRGSPTISPCSRLAGRSSFTARLAGRRRSICCRHQRCARTLRRGQFTIHTWDDLVDERRAGMRALIEMLAAGKLRPRIHDHLPLADAARAHEMLESGAVLGMLLLRP